MAPTKVRASAQEGILKCPNCRMMIRRAQPWSRAFSELTLLAKFEIVAEEETMQPRAHQTPEARLCRSRAKRTTRGDANKKDATPHNRMCLLHITTTCAYT